MSFLAELWAYAKLRKKFWLLPIILLLGFLGAIIALSTSSTLSPFIYSIF